ncbi:hypothetical protein [Psychromonas ossibalaenae]|uniref:hypothetical protein n=1 Tax=Psychromonas ossibalaenae TaxID=444922 RepID=UPI00036739C6|nr:hypothetical protein [Psychromonas ossibalaenae]
MSRYFIRNVEVLQTFTKELHEQIQIEGMVILSSLGNALAKGSYDMLWETLCKSPLYFDGDEFSMKFLIEIDRFIPADSEINKQLDPIIKRCIMPLRIDE